MTPHILIAIVVLANASEGKPAFPFSITAEFSTLAKCEAFAAVIPQKYPVDVVGHQCVEK